MSGGEWVEVQRTTIEVVEYKRVDADVSLVAGCRIMKGGEVLMKDKGRCFQEAFARCLTMMGMSEMRKSGLNSALMKSMGEKLAYIQHYGKEEGGE